MIQKKVYLNPKYVNSKVYKHHDPKNWVTFYYYKNHLKCKANISNVTSFKSYKSDVFYKDQTLSNSNNFWDYYKILKPNVDKRFKNYGVEIQRKKKEDIINVTTNKNIKIKKNITVSFD